MTGVEHPHVPDAGPGGDLHARRPAARVGDLGEDHHR